jgi:ABC-type dipeptide/oligopeptide/nickel transport system permease subunit
MNGVDGSLFALLAAVVVGAVIGLLVGMLNGAVRRELSRSGDPIGVNRSPAADWPSCTQ